MADLNIRKMPCEILHHLKTKALENHQTLRDYCIDGLVSLSGFKAEANKPNDRRKGK